MPEGPFKEGLFVEARFASRLRQAVQPRIYIKAKSGRHGLNVVRIFPAACVSDFEKARPAVFSIKIQRKTIHDATLQRQRLILSLFAKFPCFTQVFFTRFLRRGGRCLAVDGDIARARRKIKALAVERDDLASLGRLAGFRMRKTGLPSICAKAPIPISFWAAVSKSKGAACSSPTGRKQACAKDAPSQRKAVRDAKDILD